MSSLQSLDLIYPKFPCKLQQNAGKLCIWDAFSKTWRVLSPEEWVRQHALHYLVHALHYPGPNLRLELPLNIQGMPRRVDTVVFDLQGKPWMILEFKAPFEALNSKHWAQISQYQGQLKAPYLVLSNGLMQEILHFPTEDKESQALHSLPNYPDLA